MSVAGRRERESTSVAGQQLCELLPHDYEHNEAVAKELCEGKGAHGKEARPAQGQGACPGRRACMRRVS